MENLISGTDAMGLMGISNKKGSSASLLKPFGLVPVFSKKIGKGYTTFFEKEKVIAAAAKFPAVSKAQKSNHHVSAETLARIEAKLDLIISEFGIEEKNKGGLV